MCPLSDIQALRNMWKVFQSRFLIVCVGMKGNMLLRKLIYVAKWPSRFRFSTGHFLRAAETIFTQQSIKDVL